jgi:hypothetical protein
MWTWRSSSLLFCLAAALSAGGCTDRGSYRASWTFVGDEPAGSGCGRHGVDAVRVMGASTEGDSENVVTLCAGPENPRVFTHEVPVGTWTFSFQQLDVRGGPINPTDAQGQPVPDPMATASVVKDTTVDVDPLTVVLTPRPACSDGIDNDADGRIDLDDLDCASDPNGAAE